MRGNLCRGRSGARDCLSLPSARLQFRRWHPPARGVEFILATRCSNSRHAAKRCSRRGWDGPRRASPAKGTPSDPIAQPRQVPPRADEGRQRTLCDSNGPGGRIAPRTAMDIVGVFVENLLARCREWWGRDDVVALSQTSARKRLLCTSRVGRPSGRPTPYIVAQSRYLTRTTSFLRSL